MENYLKALHKERLIIQNMAIVKSQIFAEANMLITSPAWHAVKCSLWRPNILPLFVHGW